ncbi:MAG: thiamine pyrophosphate-dependent enzyme [Candidatus Asgardarchaeia archaeon]
MHYIGIDEPGKRILLMGNEAIARGAIEAGVQVAAGYPGTPSSEVIETLAKVAKEYNMHVQWSTNEKIAFEVAAGAAIVGARALMTCKNAGFNWIMDTFLTIGYGGVRGGLVIFSGDDPDAHYSSTEQDVRLLGAYANFLTLEPMDQQEAKDMTKDAFDISEEVQLPVIVRGVTRLNHASGDVIYGEIRKERNKIAFDKHWGMPYRWNVYGPPGPVAKHEWLINQQPKLKEIAEKSKYNVLQIKGKGKPAIITSGVAAAYVFDVLRKEGLEDEFNILKVGTTYPLPYKKIKELIDKSSKLIFIEEGDPVIELQTRAWMHEEKITIDAKGKMYEGILKPYGELNQDIVREAIYKFLGKEIKMDEKRKELKKSISKLIAPRSSMWCPGCPHIGSFWGIRKALQNVKAKVPIINIGIGCYEMSGYGVYGKQIKAEYTTESKRHVVLYPYEMSDTEYVMGSEFGLPQGEYFANYKDGPIIGVTGDSSFFHANLPALANAVYNNAKGVYIILDNTWTAMTGHQPNPTTGLRATLESAKKIDIEKVVRAMGVEFVKVADPYNIEETINVLTEALKYDGLAVVILRRECALQAVRYKRLVKPVYKVIEDKCTGCRICTQIGCPAVTFDFDKKKAGVDETLCVGCSLCAQVCPFDAIVEGE